MELHLAMPRQLWEWLQTHVAVAEPEGGAVLLARRSTGSRRRTLLCYRVVEPMPGEVEVRHGPGGLGLYFDPEYLARAQNEAIQEDAGIVLVHNHLLDDGPAFSRQDRKSEVALLTVLGRSVAGPLAALVLGAEGRVRAREWAWEAGGLSDAPVSCVRIVGGHVAMKFTLDAHLHDPPTEAADRAIRLWGKAGQKLLQNVRVGVAGAGGVASFVAEGLARLGVGEIVQVDFDEVQDVNISRNAGATWDDVGKTKVAVLDSWLPKVAVAEPFDYAGLPARVQDKLAELLDCDVIVSAVDGYDARDFLNEVAYRHLIGVIDCGTKLEPDDAQTRLQYGVLRAQILTPGAACLWCTGYLTRQRVTNDRLPDEQKLLANYGVREEAPAVFFTNSLVVGMVGMLLLEHLLHLSGKVPGELRFNVLTWNLHPEEDRVQEQCECQRVFGRGDTEPPPWM